MGKSGYARGKTKVKFLRKYGQENNGIIRNRGKKEEKGEKGKHIDKEERKKRSVWCKCLSFVRSHLSLRKIEYGDLSANSKETEDSSQVNFPSTVPSVDVIEIPIGTSQNTSKILLTPTRTGIKVITSQCDGTSLMAQNEEHEIALSFLNGGINPNLQKNGAEDERWNWDSDPDKNKNEIIRERDNTLTSEIYIRQDLDKVVESVAFIEPNLLNEYAESEKSGKSEKSNKFNKRHISYRVIDEETATTLKTYKTVSEPTWNEKKNIFHQQQLEENINDLLKQFMFIESEEVLSMFTDFSVPRNKAIKEKKRLQFLKNAGSIHLGSTKDVKELSRVVSPEILVNIKPFKEYLSGDYISLSHPPDEVIMRNKIFLDQCASQKEIEMQQKQKVGSEEWSIGKEGYITKKTSYHCPVVRSNFQLPHKTLLLTEEKNSKIRNGKQPHAESTVYAEREENSCFWCNSEGGPITNSQMVLVDSPERFSQEFKMCAVWGVYKSYSGSDELIREGDGRNQFSIDEVLESLDDSDHDRIFKKNITQFRRKVSVSHFDFRNSSCPGMSEMEVKKSRMHEKNLEIINKKKENISSVTEAGKIIPTKHRKPTEFRIANLREISTNCQQKFHKIFENSCLIFSQKNVVKKALGTRIETLTIRTLETLKEIQPLVENKMMVVVKKELLRIPQEGLMGNGELCVESGLRDSNMIFNDFLLSSNSFIGFEKVAKLLSVQESNLVEKMYQNINGNENSLMEVKGTSDFVRTKFLPNPTECFYMVGNYLFTDFAKNDYARSMKMYYERNPDEISINTSLNEKENTKIERLSETKDGKSTNSKIRKVVMVEVEISKQFTTVICILENTWCDYSEIIPGKSSANNSKHLRETGEEIKRRKKICPNSSMFLIKSGNSSEAEDSFIANGTTCYHFNHLNLIEKLCPPQLAMKNPKTENCSDERVSKGMPTKFDDFQVLYKGVDKECVDDEDDNEGKAESYKSVRAIESTSQRISTSVFFVTEKGEGQESCSSGNNAFLNGKGNKQIGECFKESSEIRISKSVEREIVTKLIKYKSSSSPRENILQPDYGSQDQRLRRSLNLSKEIEKDFHCCKKKRIYADKGLDIRRTGSALLESRTTKLELERSFASSLQGKESRLAENKLNNIIFPQNLEILKGAECKMTERKINPNLFVVKIGKKDKNNPLVEVSENNFSDGIKETKKILVVDKNGVNGANVRNEVLTAFNSIKDLPSRGGDLRGRTKRMSLVIMLSRK